MRNRAASSSADMKMALVIRGELRLTPGKAAVQAAHAAVLLARSPARRHADWLDAWLRQGQKKIALLAQTLADMAELEAKASRLGIPTVWVEDAGLTEVAPGTRTCLGLGPAPASELDRITGELPLL
jgi:PTH2 family peptidyl-tRNA hydrolase